MCNIFINATENYWKSRTKSLRIDGVVTSIRLEEFFWMILAEISDRDDMSVNQLITKLYLESMDAEHDIGNFTSFLRVCCGRYLSLMADGDIIRGGINPLNEIDAGIIIKAEEKRDNQRLSDISLRRMPITN